MLKILSKIALIITLSFFLFLLSIFPYITSSLFVPPIQKIHADTTNLTTTSCDISDAASTECQSAISADGGTSVAVTKNEHLDAPFSTLAVSSVNSATLYYDSWATLTNTWGIYLKDSRDGTTICSADPAPEDASETRNNLDCSSVTPTQLSNGVWLYAVNYTAGKPEPFNLDYAYLYVDYNPSVAVSISLTTDGSVDFGTQALNTTQDTTSTGLNDPETISVDSGPANLDVSSTRFHNPSLQMWMLSFKSGADQVLFEYSNDGSTWPDFSAENTNYTFDTNVPQGATRNLYLRLTTPSSTSSYDQYSTTVTITASAP